MSSSTRQDSNLAHWEEALPNRTEPSSRGEFHLPALTEPDVSLACDTKSHT